MSKRFDRWIASPKEMSVIQNYDEFMTESELKCFIVGCTWSGKHLGAHVNLCHGITASDAKRAAGFNLTTGLVTADVSERLSNRDYSWNALSNMSDIQKRGFLDKSKKALSKIERYISRERAEHQIKSRAIFDGDVGPDRKCEICGSVFKQSTKFGLTKFCSVQCRNKKFDNLNKFGDAKLICSYCYKEFTSGRYKMNRFNKGLLVTCSLDCRNKLNVMTTPNYHKKLNRINKKL